LGSGHRTQGTALAIGQRHLIAPAIRKGVLARENDGTLSNRIAKDLNRVADCIHLDFFYPVVYRIKPDLNSLMVGFG